MEFRKRNVSEVVTMRIASNAINSISQNISQNDGLESTICLLSFQLYVARIGKDVLSHSTHFLLQILLRLLGESPECRRKHFFSFTENSTEFSIIVDKELLNILVPDGQESKVEVTQCKWRPLVVEVGAMGSLTGISNIAATVIRPLADWGVSVFCLSTNLDDYVMVKESDLERALICLSRKFKVVCNTDNKLDLALVMSVMQSYTSVDSPVRKHSVISFPSPPSSESGLRPLIHPYSCSARQYVVCGVIPRELPAIGTTLLDLLLFNHRSSSEDKFVSFSVVEEDISVVLDCEDVHRFPEGSLYLNKDTWKMIKIGEEPLGFDECGIVAQVACPLAQADIYSYYICTFSTDHTLVPEGCVEKALKLLNERYVCKLIKKLNGGGVVLNGIQSLSDSSQCT